MSEEEDTELTTEELEQIPFNFINPVHRPGGYIKATWQRGINDELFVYNYNLEEDWVYRDSDLETPISTKYYLSFIKNLNLVTDFKPLTGQASFQGKLVSWKPKVEQWTYANNRPVNFNKPPTRSSTPIASSSTAPVPFPTPQTPFTNPPVIHTPRAIWPATQSTPMLLQTMAAVAPPP